jgi:hypothetical protein
LNTLLAERKGSVLRKFAMIAMVLAMTLVAAIPAIAQIGQEGEQEGESGEVNQDPSATQEGDNSIQCVNDQLVGNTGNAQSQNQAIQYASDGSPSPAGTSTIEVNPNEDVEEVFTCTAEVNQAASASG